MPFTLAPDRVGKKERRVLSAAAHNNCICGLRIRAPVAERSEWTSKLMNGTGQPPSGLAAIRSQKFGRR